MCRNSPKITSQIGEGQESPITALCRAPSYLTLVILPKTRDLLERTSMWQAPFKENAS